MRTAKAWISILLTCIPSSSSLAFAADSKSKRISLGVPNGGARRVAVEGELADDAVTSTSIFTSNAATHGVSMMSDSVNGKRPMRVLFLSSDTGGGHRASAEALAKQFLLKYPGSEYELVDLWTDHGVVPYRTLVDTYKHLSAHPLQWRLLYHISNTKLNEVGANFHSKLMSGRAIKKRIQEYNPDVIVSVHPTMNHAPLIASQKIGKELGKHIPFFTVVTDLGSGHCMWFERNVNKLYVASDRLYKLARRRGGTPKENIVMAGLPIRHGFAVQAEKLGDRTTEAGKAYQKEVRAELGLDPEKHTILVMGGGEGVGSLSDIVNNLYAKLSAQGVDATICVVCGRNEKLKNELDSRDWDSLVAEIESKPKRRGGLLRFLKRTKRSKKLEGMLHDADASTEPTSAKGNVDVVGLGFVTNMPEYMAAADVLVSKAGPGTIAEAASVGLPIMLTSFLPGQEAGNVDVVLESEFGDYCEDPDEIAQEVSYWLQHDDLLNRMSAAAQKAGNPYAADEIVDDMGSQTVAWMTLNQK
mmetsp:Transcript_120038/g.179342  ORF Transcript_120038/g.179342 Transcript_120038/m.179342 type:complete len:529 (+) Transcript_120038:98-1684(+)